MSAIPESAGDPAPKLQTVVRGIEIPISLRARSGARVIAFAARPFAFLALAVGAAMAGRDLYWPFWLTAPLFALLAQRHFQTLVHDAAHFFYHPARKTNDALANWLAGGWIGMTVANYRGIHTRHHVFNGSHEDPEFVSFDEVRAEGGLRRVILRYVFMLEALRLVRKYYGARDGRTSGGKGLTRLWSVRHIVGVQVLLLSVFFACGVWQLYLVWLYLAVSWSPLLSRLRFLVEHPGEGSLAVSTSAWLVERWYFAPLNFCYHFEHHSWPDIPPYRLEQAHAFLRKSRFFEQHPQFAGSGFVRTLRRRAAAHS